MDDVSKFLQKIQPRKATGIDGIPNVLLKHCAIASVPSITALFNMSIRLGIVPSEWKQANIIPIFKKGDSNNVQNYRPVSLLPVISKI